MKTAFLESMAHLARLPRRKPPHNGVKSRQIKTLLQGVVISISHKREFLVVKREVDDGTLRSRYGKPMLKINILPGNLSDRNAYAGVSRGHICRLE